MTKDGVQLDSKGVVTTAFPYEHVVEVRYQHRAVDDFADVQMLVDDILACHLSCRHFEIDEPGLSLTRDALASQYGVQVPVKIVLQDTRSMARKLAGRVWQDWEKKNGPLDEVMAKKASETGNFVSKIMSDTYWFFDSMRTPSTELDKPLVAPIKSPMPSLLTSRANRDNLLACPPLTSRTPSNLKNCARALSL